MAETGDLELVAAADSRVRRAVQRVVAPGVEGLFGVLPRHAPLLSDLARGVVEVHENGQVVNRFMIDGGLADVSGESVTILTERAEDLDSADRDAIKSRAEAASGSEADFLNAVLDAI